MKRIIIASALVFSALFACQKPIELNEIVNTKPNGSRSSEDENGGVGTDFHYNATLVASKDKNDNKNYLKFFEEFPTANSIYEYSYSNKKASILSIFSLSGIFITPSKELSYNAQSDPVTIIEGVLRQFKVCSTSSNPQIQCISQAEMKTRISQAFISAGYELSSVSVSENGNIEVVIRPPVATLGSCIATIIAYFN